MSVIFRRRDGGRMKKEERRSRVREVKEGVKKIDERERKGWATNRVRALVCEKILLDLHLSHNL